MKVGCIIEARTTSTRLPGKVLRSILGKPMIERMIERLRLARTLDGIILATTDNATDDEVAELGRRLEIGVFRGSEEDVLARVLGAAEAHAVDLIVETPGDCPLIDPGLIDKLVGDFRIGGVDFVRNAMAYNTPPGADIRVFRTADLAEINRISRDPADHEHVSLHFYEHPEKYRIRDVGTDLPTHGPLRLTVDTQDDFAFVTAVYEELHPRNPAFGLGDIVDLLVRRPDIRGLNEGVRQKKVR
jgi:spore coat polysaccharide biosynthesis protein SpsF